MTAAPARGPGSGATVGGMQYAVEDERRSDITRKAGRQSVARLNFLSDGESDGARPKLEIGVADLQKEPALTFR